MREFRELEIDTVHESATNPRRAFPEASLKELAASVRRYGVLQPILVRPNGNGFVLIAGARRLRAARLAECTMIPARVLGFDDAMADEATIIENLHREEVHPLDEAASYERLIARGRSVDELAATLGKPKSYIYQRVSLMQLVPKVQELLAQDELPLNYALKLATVPAERQEEGLRICFRPLFQEEPSRDHLEPLASLTHWIEKSVRIDPRSEQARVLLPELADQVAAVEQERKAAVIAVSALTFHTDRADPKPILAKSWKRAEGKDRCKHARPGVIVLGPGQGTFLQVCIAKKACDKHWRKPKEDPATSVAAAEQLKRAAERRDEDERLEAQRALQEKWHRELRIPAIRMLASRAASLKWTPSLFSLLMHDMRVGEVFDEMVGAPGTIPVARYPQAFAVALAFAHSWRREDLLAFSKRLRVPLKTNELTEETLLANAAPAAPTAPAVSRPPKGKKPKGKGRRRM